MSAESLVEYVARSLVDNPDEVTVKTLDDQDGRVIELHVAEDDMGKVIGRNGSVAKALRTLLKVVAAREGESVSLEIARVRPSTAAFPSALETMLRATYGRSAGASSPQPRPAMASSGPIAAGSG